MENATKALVMAGGVLIAIMIIATLLYASSTWRIIPEQEGETAAAKQLAAFNGQYESYARDALYGTDLVSVLNKAIDNNERYDVHSKYERMYVNIEFVIIKQVDETTTTYRMYIDGENAGNIIEDPDKNSISKMALSAGEYSLADHTTKIKGFIAKVEKEKREGKYKIDKGQKYQEYTETIAGGSEFKSRIFKCTHIDYDDGGRINYMRFEEQEIVAE